MAQNERWYVYVIIWLIIGLQSLIYYYAIIMREFVYSCLFIL